MASNERRDGTALRKKSSFTPAASWDEKALYEYAVQALGRRMRTVAELKRLLRTKVEPDERDEDKVSAVISSVLSRLKEQHYIDDASFASTYTRLRQENDGFGKFRVQRELARKGIARNLIASTLDAAYRNTSEEELARNYLARKRIGKPQNQKETVRVLRRLFAAGFSAPTVRTVLKSWQIEVGEEMLEMPDETGREPR